MNELLLYINSKVHAFDDVKWKALATLWLCIANKEQKEMSISCLLWSLAWSRGIFGPRWTVVWRILGQPSNTSCYCCSGTAVSSSPLEQWAAVHVTLHSRSGGAETLRSRSSFLSHLYSCSGNCTPHWKLVLPEPIMVSMWMCTVGLDTFSHNHFLGLENWRVFQRKLAIYRRV